MISLNDSYQLLKAAIENYNLPTKTISVAESFGYIIARDQYSKLDVPLFSRSSMDGYAVMADDDSVEFRVIELVPAGKAAEQILQTGKAIKIMTGAPIPVGTGRIVPIEYADENAGVVKFTDIPEKKNIAWQGEDLKTGDLLFKSGIRIDAVVIANLVNCGITEIEAYEQPRVAILTTGDEIVSDPQELTPGKIMNSNSPMLAALCKQHGLNVIANVSALDNKAGTSEAIAELEKNADIIILTGGVSVGDYDFVAEAVQANGYKIHFNKVAIKPGKPITFASKDNKLIFGLPGNPVSVYVTFYLFALKAMELITKCDSYCRMLNLPLANDHVRSSVERMEFIPGKLQSDGTVLTIKSHGAGHMAALLECDGFIVIPVGILKISAKSQIDFMQL